MSGVHTVTTGDDAAGQRLDRWFRRAYPQVTHGRLEKLLRSGQVRVDGKRVKASYRLQVGQSVRVPPLPDPDGTRPPARPSTKLDLSTEEIESLRQRILYRDESVIALDKPAGLAVQGGSGQKRHLDAMLDALRFGADDRPRLVHRLDKDTCGVLLLARNATVARALTASFRGHAVQKVYWAAVAGVPAQKRGRILLPLAKQDGPGGEKVATDAAAGQHAETLFQLVETWRRKISWLVLMPLTGRTHQLRVHCAAMGTPILGDGKYGGRAAFASGLDLPRRLMLQANEIALPHPVDGTTLRVSAPLPEHMSEVWRHGGFNTLKGADAAAALADYASGLSHSP